MAMVERSLSPVSGNAIRQPTAMTKTTILGKVLQNDRDRRSTYTTASSAGYSDFEFGSELDLPNRPDTAGRGSRAEDVFQFDRPTLRKQDSSASDVGSGVVGRAEMRELGVNRQVQTRPLLIKSVQSSPANRVELAPPLRRPSPSIYTRPLYQQSQPNDRRRRGSRTHSQAARLSETSLATVDSEYRTIYRHDGVRRSNAADIAVYEDEPLADIGSRGAEIDRVKSDGSDATGQILQAYTSISRASDAYDPLRRSRYASQLSAYSIDSGVSELSIQDIEAELADVLSAPATAAAQPLQPAGVQRPIEARSADHEPRAQQMPSKGVAKPENPYLIAPQVARVGGRSRPSPSPSPVAGQAAELAHRIGRNDRGDKERERERSVQGRCSLAVQVTHEVSVTRSTTATPEIAAAVGKDGRPAFRQQHLHDLRSISSSPGIDPAAAPRQTAADARRALLPAQDVEGTSRSKRVDFAPTTHAHAPAHIHAHAQSGVVGQSGRHPSPTLSEGATYGARHHGSTPHLSRDRGLHVAAVQSAQRRAVGLLLLGLICPPLWLALAMGWFDNIVLDDGDHERASTSPDFDSRASDASAAERAHAAAVAGAGHRRNDTRSTLGSVTQPPSYALAYSFGADTLPTVPRAHGAGHGAGAGVSAAQLGSGVSGAEKTTILKARRRIRLVKTIALVLGVLFWSASLAGLVAGIVIATRA